MKAVITNYDRNRKIYAIKALRAVTGYGLKEAKETIDNVPIAINLSWHQIDALRSEGISIETNVPHNLPLDKIQIMRELVMTLLIEGQFKSAQYVIDAMEALDEN
jgi:hypothetical protein